MNVITILCNDINSIRCCIDLSSFDALIYNRKTVVVEVCKKWSVLASDNALWSNIFKERWGVDNATFYAPVHPKSWKDVYVVQDRCDRIGLWVSNFMFQEFLFVWDWLYVMNSASLTTFNASESNSLVCNKELHNFGLQFGKKGVGIFLHC